MKAVRQGINSLKRQYPSEIPVQKELDELKI